MSTEDNKTTVRRYLEDYSPADQRVLDELSAPGYVHHSQAGPLDLDGFKRGLAMYHAAFPDGRLDIHDGDRVVVRMTLHGTHQGNPFGIPATGQAVNWAMMTMYRLEDGKVQEDWELSDRLGMLQQLGVKLQRPEG